MIALLLSGKTWFSYANPEGGIVSAGEVQINYNHQSKSNYTEIVQHTERAIIDWRKFDIAPQEHTNFKQPSSESITLNRIHSDESSKINGQLTANGKLILINQNGIMFDQNSKVDVNGILATTANISNDQFMRSEKLKEQQLLFESQGSAEASIVNKGAITAAKGLVGLVAPNVVSSGLIVAKAGKVTLASGDHFTLDLQGDCLLDVGISEEVKSQILANTGQVIAEGGKIFLTAAAGKDIVNSLVVNTGLLAARSISRKNGEIIISAEGSNAVKNNIASDKGKKQGNSTVLINGIIDVSGFEEGESGGKLQITGDCIWLMSGTLINASGHSGKAGIISGNNLDKSVKRPGSAGGEILIGGDYLGQGDIPNAINVYVDPDALIFNDAIDNGDAGRNIFWSDGVTQFYGSVYARALGGKGVDLETGNALAGGNLGDGGFIETSGKGRLDALGNVDLTASNGEVGTYFLDPSTVAIYGGVDPTFSSTDGTTVNLLQNLRVWIDFSRISNVTLQYTNNNGTVASGITGVNILGSNTLALSKSSVFVQVGVRIKLVPPGSPGIYDINPNVIEPLSGTNGSNIYTVTAIGASNTYTVSPSLKRDYQGWELRAGFISKVAGRAYNVDAVLVKNDTANNFLPPLWMAGSSSGDGSNVAASLHSGGFYIPQYLNIKKNQGYELDYISSQTNFTYFIAFKEYSNGGDSGCLFSLNNSTSGYNAYKALHFYPSYRSDRFFPGVNAIVFNPNNSSVAQYSYFAVKLTKDILHLISIQNDYDARKIGLYVEGTLDSQGLQSIVSSDIKISTINPINHYLGAMQHSSNGDPSVGFAGLIYEVIEYNSALANNVRSLVEQYQSVKLNVNLTTIPNTSPTESVPSYLSAEYLAKLSTNQNIVVSADNVIVDLKDNNFTLADDKNLEITASNSLSVPSTGTITTKKTNVGGNIKITLNSGNLDLSNLSLNATNDGDTRITTNNGNVILGNITAGTITVNANNGNITIPQSKSLKTTSGVAPSLNSSIGEIIDNRPHLTVNITSQWPLAAIYGGDPDFNNVTYSVTGYLATDNQVGDISGSLLFTTNYDRNNLNSRGVGFYSVTVSAANLTSQLGYSIKTDPINYVVNQGIQVQPKDLIVTADNKTKVYGESDPILSFTASGLVNGDPTSIINVTLIRASGQSVGNYIINMNDQKVSAGDNYNATFSTGMFTITKKICRLQQMLKQKHMVMMILNLLTLLVG